MASRSAIAADLDQEFAETRALLADLPVGAWAWAPHPKSFTLGALAGHLADLPHWGAQLLHSSFYDLASGGGHRGHDRTLTQVLEVFDRHVRELSLTLDGLTDDELAAEWSLQRGATVVATMTRVTALRRLILHHLVHHRGQLTVYLRLLDRPLPALYGPTADSRP